MPLPSPRFRCVTHRSTRCPATASRWQSGGPPNQQQSAIWVIALARECPLANRLGEAPQAERTSRGCHVQSSQKRLKDERIAKEIFTQWETGGEARITGALQKATGGPGQPSLDIEGCRMESVSRMNMLPVEVFIPSNYAQNPNIIFRICIPSQRAST